MPDENDRVADGPLPKTVLYVHHGRVPGGAPTSLRTLLEGIRHAAPQVRLVVACIFDDIMPYFAEVEGVEVVKYVQAPVITGKKFIGWSPLSDLRTTLRSLRQLARVGRTIREEMAWLQQLRPDVVHLNSSVLWTTAIAAKRCGIPVVWHVRETLFGSRWSLRKHLYGRFLRDSADAVIAISPQDAESLGSDNEGKVTVVYNPIDLSRFVSGHYDSARTRTEIGLPPDVFAILSLGGFSPRKGALQLVKALKRLPDHYHLVVAGDRLPPDSSGHLGRRLIWRLEDIAVRHGLRATQTRKYAERVCAEAQPIIGRIHQLGHVTNVPPVIAACDVLVFGGTIPHFARPIYEAWAMEKPVVGFDTPVLRAEVSEGQDGLLPPRDSIDDIVSSLRMLAENPEIAREFGLKGRGKVMRRIDPHRSVEMTLNVYRKVLGRRHLPTAIAGKTQGMMKA
ncbi:MAG: glycosyltransferase family 4 protein [Oricola sp.]